MGVDDAPQFIGQQFGQLIPGHLDVFVGATLVAGAGALRSQPLRTAGAVTRAWCRMEPGMFCSSGEGSRSVSIGVTPITSPSRTSGVNAPQWVWESRAEPLT